MNVPSPLSVPSVPAPQIQASSESLSIGVYQEDGTIVALCLDLSVIGCGDTIQESLFNVREAVESMYMLVDDEDWSEEEIRRPADLKDWAAFEKANPVGIRVPDIHGLSVDTRCVG